MKKILSILAMALITIATVSLSSCSKDDKTVDLPDNPLSGTCWDYQESIPEHGVYTDNYMIFQTNYFYEYQTITVNGTITSETCSKHAYEYDSDASTISYNDSYGLVDTYKVSVSGSKLILSTGLAATTYTKATQPKTLDDLAKLCE